MLKQSWNPVLNKIIELKKLTGWDNSQDVKENLIKYLINQLYETHHPKAEEFMIWANCLIINQWNDYCLLRYKSFFEVLEILETLEIVDNNYIKTDEDYWNYDNGIFRECRSLVVDLKHDELVLTPYKKFFNMGQLPETSKEIIEDKIKNAKTIEFSNKLDGSMQQARYYNGQIIMSGSQAINPNLEFSWRLKDGYNMLLSDNSYINMIKNNPDYTFIFEYISPKDKHIVIYTEEQEGLYLIGIRNSVTGKELNYKEVLAIGNAYGVKMTTLIDTNLQKIYKTLDKVSASDAEGFVINIDDMRVKLKYDDYIKLHKFLASALSKNKIIEYIQNDTLDDVASKLPEIYRQEFFNKVRDIMMLKKNIENNIKMIYDKLPHIDNRKEFFINLNNTNIHKCLKGQVGRLYLNEPIDILSSRPFIKYKYLVELNEISDNCLNELIESIEEKKNEEIEL